MGRQSSGTTDRPAGQLTLPDLTDAPPTVRGTAGAALDELMTADQVAALLFVPASTVQDYARRGLLPSIKLGKHRRFVRSQVQTAIAELARARRR